MMVSRKIYTVIYNISFIFFNTVTIRVWYSPEIYTIAEGQGMVQLTIKIFDPPTGSPRPFTLVVNTQDDTASMFEDKTNIL